MVVGECLHKKVICSCGKYQNYCCPYSDITKCPSAIVITEEMVEQWKMVGSLALDSSNNVVWGWYRNGKKVERRG